MTKNQAQKQQIKEKLLETIKTDNPSTTKKLIELVQEQLALPEEEITNVLLDLEKDDSLQFVKRELPTPASIKQYILSEKATWYWITVALSLLTVLAVFTIPENSFPLVYLRIGLGFIFILFLPGFGLVKVLFPIKGPIQSNSESMDNIVLVALSFGATLAITPLVALILNYSPWGVTLLPITLSLLVLTLTFASVALLREHQAKIALSTQEKM